MKMKIEYKAVIALKNISKCQAVDTYRNNCKNTNKTLGHDIRGNVFYY